jgi:hypothetical protein
MAIGIAVKLKEDFSIVRETLERIGIMNRKTKMFYPSCYCIETKDPEIFRIVHFKELFPLFQKESTYNNIDSVRCKTIVHLIKNWNLIEVVDPSVIDEILSEKITVLKHAEKKDFQIIHKFKFSKKIILDN